MISQYLQSIQGIQLVGVVSLIVCLAAFLGIVVFALRADKQFIRTMERLPLDADEDHTPPSEKVPQ